MRFAKKWGHELAATLVALWCAIGVAGQQGIYNLAANVVAQHKWAAAVVAAASVVVARLRPSPVK